MSFGDNYDFLRDATCQRRLKLRGTVQEVRDSEKLTGELLEGVCSLNDIGQAYTRVWSLCRIMFLENYTVNDCFHCLNESI